MLGRARTPSRNTEARASQPTSLRSVEAQVAGSDELSPMENAYPCHTLTSLNGLGYATYRDRRSATWSTVDAALTSATLGSPWDVTSLSSPLTQHRGGAEDRSPTAQLHSNELCSPTDSHGTAAEVLLGSEDAVACRAACLDSILAGQAQELHELKKALARGPAGFSQCVRAAIRLEECHRSALGEVQLLHKLGDEMC